MTAPFRADQVGSPLRPASPIVARGEARRSSRSSPQCGFSSQETRNKLSQGDQWRKLELIVPIARKAWGGVLRARRHRNANRALPLRSLQPAARLARAGAFHSTLDCAALAMNRAAFAVSR